MAAINMVKKLMGGLAGIHFECELVDDTEAREKTGVVIRYDDRGLPMFSITGFNELPQITIQLDYTITI